MQTSPEVGIYLKDSAPLIRAVKRLLIQESELINPEVALPRPDRVTVYLTNHGPFIAPYPAAVLTVEHLLESGDYDDLIAVTLFHWIVEFIPGISPLLKRYFGHSTQKLRSMSGVIKMMKERRFQVIGTAPEGSSCVMAYDDPVGPFTRCGLMVAGLLADADIVMAAQSGVEIFGKRVLFPGGLALPLAHGPRGVLIPRWSPGLKAHVKVKYRRYEALKPPQELAALEGSARRAALGNEITRIQGQLNELYLSIP